ncbi:MAG: transposase [Phycisphaeraceae bacterium]|nr:transposase [Phycisphaeraceae bacterium]
MGEARKEALKLSFDGSVRLLFHGATVGSDGGLLAYRNLDDALALTALAGTALNDWRRGTNIRHSMTALLRQSIYSRLAGYDDLNDADRLCVDPVMRQVVGGRAGLRSGEPGMPVPNISYVPFVCPHTAIQKAISSCSKNSSSAVTTASMKLGPMWP